MVNLDAASESLSMFFVGNPTNGTPIVVLFEGFLSLFVP